MSEGQPPKTPPTNSLPPISQPFPGSLTPGWNDPPSVQYNPTPVGTPGRTKLNKRVPFPLQQSNATTTKPTAIVQPCQAPNPTTHIGITSNSSNIAVVHPLQHTSTEITTQSPMLPPVAAGLSIASGLGGALAEPPITASRESNNSLNQMPTIQTTEVGVPRMFVPAVPRQPDAPTAQSNVQHL